MKRADQPLKIGTVIFEGFELLDVFGPLEMFGLSGAELFLISEETGEIESAQGPAAVAGEKLGGEFGCDVLLVPGGIGTRILVGSDAFLAALRTSARRAKYLASVCTGSALLARAGLLDGKRATSNKAAFGWVAEQGPRVDWVRKARWVEDGNVFTSSGVSAGMDMALAIIARLRGRDEALRVAREAEYVWNEESGNDPFARGRGFRC